MTAPSIYPRMITGSLFSSTPSSYQVVAGMHDKEKKDGTTVDVSEIHIHPSRNEGKNSNDAAVLVLAKPVSFSKNVSPICLPDEDVSDDTSCVTTGWGDTKGMIQASYRSAVL